ncbi:MAG: acyl-CoA dehydrogenase family protein [Acidimicrobiia bacterium]|jgi:3-oxocholest-4-en-26-oyl-CoA dehydrogenase alpha subunit|nr:acyl-CoA dehydrogenase family protein [Acidimicrobiia bacterium]
MYIGLTEEQQKLQLEVREYYRQLLTPEVRASLANGGGVGPAMRKVVRQMGSDGWLGVGWPKEWGGRGFTAVEQFIWFDESMRAGAPVPMLTINTVGPTIMNFGSEEQKKFFVPKILAGEIHFCIGYSEPGAGTDLAALRTKAERDGDEYIINGQKMWTSLASDADYIWLAARTDPEVKKNKGISLFVLPMDTTGIKVLPIQVMGETDINQTFFEDVRIPASYRVGEENEGWKLITTQLNHERVTLCSSGMVERALNDTRAWAQETRLADGTRVIDQEWVQISLARVHSRLEFLRLINWKIAWASTQGALSPADASATKVYGTEFYLEAFRSLMEIIGQHSYLKNDAPGSVLQARLEHSYRGLIILTFGGGTNEIQRDLIAVFGLNMPLAPR